MIIKTARLAAAIVILAIALAAAIVSPARAQFDAQQTYVASSTGGANAFTVTVPNINQASDLVGVPLRVLMSASNSGAATLSVSNGSSTILSNVAINKPTTSGLAALVGNEIRSGQINTFIYDGTVVELSSPTLSLATTQTQNGFAPATNLQLSGSVNSNQLTITVLAGSTGAAPSAAAPVTVPFRDSTIANGDPVWLSITSSLSFTIGSGSTMGCRNGVMCRLWVFLANDGGTVRVCAYNANSAGASVIGINEAVLQTSGAGTSGGNSAQTLYCNAAITNRAVRYAGYVDVQESVAGTWSTGPTYVQLFGPGVHKPGQVIQTIYATTAVASTTTTGVMTSTIASINPTAAANLMLVRATGNSVGNNGGAGAITQLVRNSSQANSFGTSSVGAANGVAATYFPTALEGLDQPNTTSATTYGVFLSTTSAGNTVGWLGNNSGVSTSSSIVIEEIQG